MKMRPHARQIGIVTATALVLGNMVGSGIFLLPASLASFGGYSLWGWGISAVGALLLAWVFSRLARRQPKAGGPYAYTRTRFGDFVGFLVAWGYWISMIAANAAIAVAFASYLSVFIPVLATSPLAGALVTLTAVWAIILINILGIRSAGRVQVVTTILKLVPLIALALFGLAYFNPHILASGHYSGSPFSAIDATIALTLWAFLGLESATIPADHVRNASKTIPRATLLGTSIAALLYIACTVAIMGIIPAATLAHSNAPFADAARLLWGNWAGWLIAVTAAVSCFGALNGWVMMTGQLPRAVARDHLFPSFFARESSRGTPTIGLLLGGVLTSLLVMTNYSHGLVAMFTFIILLSTLSTLIPYVFCAAVQLIYSWETRLGSAYALRDLLFAGGALAFALWAIKGTGLETIFWGLLLILIGVPVYIWQTRGRRKATVS